MKKWLNNIVFSALLSWMIYCIVSFSLQETILKNKGSSLILKVYSEEKVDLDYSINLPLWIDDAKVHKVKLDQGFNDIILPFSDQEYINSIFLKPKKFCTFYLNSVYLSNAYKEIRFTKDEILPHLKYSKSNKKDFKIVDNKGIKIDINKKNYCVELLDELSDKINAKLDWPINLISLIVASIGFVIIILNSSKLPKASIKLNFCLLFLTLIFTPFFSKKESQTSENRALAPFPDLHVNIWRIPPKYTNYFNDHLPFRSLLNKAYCNIMVRIFNISPNPNFSQFGKEGWLFYSTPQIKDVYRGSKQFTDDELEQIKNRLETIAKNLKNTGIDFYLMIPPLKHSIYPEFIPGAIQKIKGRKTKREQILSYLKEKNSFVHVIDPYPVLMALKDTMETYYKTDTHWNKLAAFRVYQQTIDSLNNTHPKIGEASKIENFNVSIANIPTGDLIQSFNVGELIKRKVYDIIPKSGWKHGVPIVGETVKGETNYLYYNSDSSLKNKPRLLMYRDSYASYLHPFLAEHFSYSGYSWTRKFNMDRVKKSKPDIIIYEVMERFIDELLPN